MTLRMAVLLTLLVSGAGVAHADGREKEPGLVLASESYFGVPEPEIESVRAQGVAFAEIPVVLFLATRAHTQPEKVAQMRLSGRSWMEVARAINLRPRIFYLPVERPAGPYVRIYALYNERPAEQWDSIELDDAGVVDMVNLRFLSEHYGCEPERIIDMRAGGHDFVAIHDEVRGEIELDGGGDVAAYESLEPEYETDFYDETESYYGMTETQVNVARQRQLPDTEMPVALFIASQAKVEPAVVVDLRLRGMTWMEISRRWSLGPEVYYVPIETTSGELVSGPPYGKAYGYYKKHPRKDWNRIVLSDSDVINLVNLRFVSEHYGTSTDSVIRMRSQGTPFTTIYRDVTIEKKKAKGHSDHGKKKGHADKGGKQKESHGKGKSKGGKGKGGKNH